MKLRSSLCVLTTLLALAGPTWAQPQANPLRGPNPPGPAAEPDQPVRPQLPTLEPRGEKGVRNRLGEAPSGPFRQTVPDTFSAPQPPPPPFQLTPQQEAQVDRALNLWEQRNKDIKTFDCRFKRWIYDVVFGPPNEAKFIEIGVIKYATPDRGLFYVEKEEKGGKETAIPDARAEHWIADGKSIWERKPGQKKWIEHKLPPELQGKAIVETPLPFLFNAEAQKLKQRYWIRIATPANVQDQVWLEAYPRFQKDAANFHHSIFVITTQGMVPFALRVVQPNGKDFTAYQFYDIVVNDPLRLFQGNPFRVYVPPGWQTIVEEPPPAAQARRPPGERR